MILIGGRDQHQRVKEPASMIKSIRKVICLGKTNDIDSYDDFISECTPDSSADPLDPNLISTILYTRGITGKPKGAVIDRNVLSARA